MTIDNDTPSDEAVTVRFRDTMEQKRVPIRELNALIDEKVSMKSLLKNL